MDTKTRRIMTALSTSPRFTEHDTGPQHPERPDRIRAIHTAIRQAGLVDSPNPFPGFQCDLGLHPVSGEKLLELSPKAADEKWLATVHTRRMIESIRRACESGGGLLDQGDTPVQPESFQIALLSLGSLLGCCDAVVDGRARRAFSAARPPGHHAETDRAMGFCLFANVAIAAKYLQQHHGVGKVAIVDFDVHHGNGTQACLEEDPTTLFISLHQHPDTCYPGSGFERETGIGAGEGFTLNIPFQPGAEDADYLKAMDEQVTPALDRFRPEFLLLSAGFDAHRDDPLAEIKLSEEGFEQITRRLVAVAEAHCQSRVVSALEGGYNLRALGRSVVRHLVALRDI
jgi:acetoin utilization deacetylase AcuC-like enzyme